ncbi:hypothetical protein KFK09_024021 [Dendrobium nobile]|uniref:Uncharacterized protein n=1 Tax=Dendrobium nobile TaxID=94219 RepID=A0A8T3ACW8_DENNO|nr:hypothetical protein KFK09_024021 [Dendrobium nobile]
MNICLMVGGESDCDSLEVCNDISYEKLDDTFNELVIEYKKLKRKYNALEKEHKSLDMHFHDLKNECDDLKKNSSLLDRSLPVCKLERENIILKARLDLCMKSYVYYKSLSSTTSNKNSSYMSHRIHANPYANTNIWCHYYGRKGHISFDCFACRSQNAKKSSFVWIPKNTNTSTTIHNRYHTTHLECGPKNIWVPKVNI